MHAAGEEVVAAPTGNIVEVGAAGFMCARRVGNGFRHALRSSPRDVEAPPWLLGKCRSAKLLILILSVFTVRRRLKTTLHWGCGLGAAASELDLMLLTAAVGVVTASWSDAVDAGSFDAA